MNDAIFRKLLSCVSDILKDFELHQMSLGEELNSVIIIPK